MEKAILAISGFTKSLSGWSDEDLKDELKELTLSAGAATVGEVFCHPKKFTRDLLVGKGKIGQLKQEAIKKEADVIIFNLELSPAQQRNIEELVETKVIDRTQLILDIFARIAKSKEGQIQVELAQLQYLLPRLVGKGIVLSRLGGGIGTRGPGEQKLEVDRRRISKRIGRLKKELQEITKHREILRDKRKKLSLPLISIIGYTNAGKSTLFNTLTGSAVPARDRLFSTLDPKTRGLALPNKQKVVFTDTVGFLADLPHHLIESFKATLEEVVQADILLHVLDVSHPMCEEQVKSVYKVLDEIGISDKPVITVLNKVDKVDSKFVLQRMQEKFSGSIPVSALTGEGCERLAGKIMMVLEQRLTILKLKIPHQAMDILARIYREGNVLHREFLNDGVYIEAQVPLKLKSQIANRKGVI